MGGVEEAGGEKELEEEDDEEEGPLTTKNLLSWSCQVARGMEYLGSKKVTLHPWGRPVVCSSDPAR